MEEAASVESEEREGTLGTEPRPRGCAGLNGTDGETEALRKFERTAQAELRQAGWCCSVHD